MEDSASPVVVRRLLEAEIGLKLTRPSRARRGEEIRQR